MRGYTTDEYTSYMVASGVTLVELTVVIAIMIIIYGAVFLSKDFIFSRTLQSETQALVSDIRWTRQVCVNRHTDVCVRFDQNDYTVYEGTCGGSSRQLRSRSMMSSLVDITTPFDVDFYTSSKSPPRTAGCADSNRAVNGIITFSLVYEGARARIVDIYEDTGSIIVR